MNSLLLLLLLLLLLWLICEVETAALVVEIREAGAVVHWSDAETGKWYDSTSECLLTRSLSDICQKRRRLRYRDFITDPWPQPTWPHHVIPISSFWPGLI